MITIEHPDYMKIEVLNNKFRGRNPQIIGIGSSFAMKGKHNIFERSYTGRMTVVHMDDGTQLINYQEMRELPGYNNFRMVGVSIIYGYDSSLVKIESTGEVVVLDALDFTDKANVSPEQLNQSMMS